MDSSRADAVLIAIVFLFFFYRDGITWVLKSVSPLLWIWDFKEEMLRV